MVEKFRPEINRVYSINQYSLIQIIEGGGSIEVDFRNYFDWENKAIYLEKGQYIKFLSDDFFIRKIEFPNENLFKNKNVRVLFKHLISLGYINFKDCQECEKFLSNTVFSIDTQEILDISSRQWYWQNPFQANKDEYQIIFDIKDVIDKEFKNQISVKDIAGFLTDSGHNAQSIVKNKLGISIKSLMLKKRLLESKKEIAFTDKNIQEISHGLGYSDPSYFNKIFKSATGQNPLQFRSDYDFENRDQFAQNLIELIKAYHTNEKSLAFYAEKMNLSIKTLSKKVRAKMNTSLGQLIRFEILNTSKLLLKKGENIQDIALYLGFKEPNHFSSFFKQHTKVSPSEFKNEKYNI